MTGLKVPTVQIIAIGTELVLGRIQDTNSFWLSQQLTELGAEVRRITVLPDVLEEVIPVLQGAADDKADFGWRLTHTAQGKPDPPLKEDAGQARPSAEGGRSPQQGPPSRLCPTPIAK